MLICQITLLLCGITGIQVAHSCAEHKDVCTTKVCKQTARKFLKNMDRSVEPCNDFYGFACGSFVKDVKLRTTQAGADFTSDIYNTLAWQLRKLLNQTSGFSDNNIYKKLRRFHALCMNEATINARGVDDAVKILRTAGGWPVLEKNWKKNNWSYIDTEIWMTTVLNSALISVDVLPDTDDPSKLIIGIDQPSIDPPREYATQGYNNSVVRVYRKLLVDMAVAFGANRETAIKEQKKTLNFFISLAKITTKSEDMRDKSKMPHMSLEKLKERWGWLDWDKLLNGLLPHGMRPLTETDQVLVKQPSYLNKLENLLRKFSNRVVANYMMSEAAIQLAPILSDNVREMANSLIRAMAGVTATKPRWEICQGKVSESFSIALSSLYVKRYFNNQTKEEASDIASEIRREIIKVFQEVTWMDQKTKILAKEKASNILQFIGYPPELLEDEQLESYHKDLRMNESSFLKARLDLVRWERDMGWRHLQKPLSRSDWRIHSTFTTTINAFYIASMNSIDVTAAILQPPLFNIKLPKHLNLATLGTVIGHEFTHGFDDQGRQYDAEGRVRNWWSEEIIQKFTKQKQCIIDQYGSFNDTKQTLLKLNGINVQGEAIADNGGLKLAYRVFKNLGTDQVLSLPGFENYTTEQLFFMSFANLWCSKYRNEFMKTQIMTDFHPPNEFRVNGALQNFEPFSKAFSCSPGSQMNPEKKCQVW